jgi:hypothetical protein
VGLDANLSAKAYAGLTIDLNIDGVLSPEFSPDAYLQLSVDLFKNPWWTLSAGLEGGASVKVGIFGVDLADFDAPDLFDFSKVIAQASGGFTGSSAVPVLNLVSPTSTLAGSQGLTLTLTGLNFVPGATVSFNGASITTAYGSPTQLTAFLPASALTTAGTFLVVVTNPDQTGARSEPFMFVVQPASSSGSVSWTQKFPATAPSPRYGHSMSYDAARNQVVLFGGLTVEGNNNETWVWDGSTWTQKFPATAPSPRYGHSMSYDAARNQVVLFGGLTIEGYNNDTWVWDGSTWTQKAPATNPPARYDHAMAYDGYSGQVVMFGGYTAVSGFWNVWNDTWTWDGSNWMQRSPPNGPSARCCHAMVYDAPNNQVLLFGGRDYWIVSSDTTVFSDTWVWKQFGPG